MIGRGGEERAMERLTLWCGITIGLARSYGDIAANHVLALSA